MRSSEHSSLSTALVCVFDILPQGAYYIQYCLNNILIELKQNCDRDVGERDVAKAQS